MISHSEQAHRATMAPQELRRAFERRAERFPKGNDRSGLAEIGFAVWQSATLTGVVVAVLLVVAVYGAIVVLP